MIWSDPISLSAGCPVSLLGPLRELSALRPGVRVEQAVHQRQSQSAQAIVQVPSLHLPVVRCVASCASPVDLVHHPTPHALHDVARPRPCSHPHQFRDARQWRMCPSDTEPDPCQGFFSLSDERWSSHDAFTSVKDLLVSGCTTSLLVDVPAQESMPMRSAPKV